MASSAGGRLSQAILLYGTEEPRVAIERMAVGPLSFGLAGHALRYLCWHGREVVRGIDFVVRDENWGTYPITIDEQWREQEEDRMRLLFEATIEGGALSYRLEIGAAAEGRLRCSATATARTDFATNRTGFVLLHPIEGVAGARAEVTHSDGSVERGRFPRRVAPAQPFFDIRVIRHAPAPGLELDCRFAGEVFEMEDQRNWSDASFKSYCRPLALPFPYRIAAGEQLTQEIELALAGRTTPPARRSRPHLELGAETGERMPALALALEPGWEPPAAALGPLRATGANSLLARIDLRGDWKAQLATTTRTATDLALPVEFELITPDDEAARESLAALAAALERSTLVPASLIALPAAYLRSYQPSGPWPEGVTPEDLQSAVRELFPTVPVGAGMLTNFTEFNRHPPRRPFDFATHANCAIVHAADDISVMETLECLPHIFASARALIGDAGYRLGLLSIGARSNPYGADVAANPEQRRVAMARRDPRQRGLFGAAYAIGLLARTEGFAIDRLALAAPAGPFGCVHRPQDGASPGYDGLAEDSVPLFYPLYHALRFLAGAGGWPRLACRVADGDGIAALAWRGPEGVTVCLANLGGQRVEVALPGSAFEARILDTGSAGAAIGDPEWSAAISQAVGDSILLDAYAVARLDRQAE